MKQLCSYHQKLEPVTIVLLAPNYHKSLAAEIVIKVKEKERIYSQGELRIFGKPIYTKDRYIFKSKYCKIIKKSLFAKFIK